MRHLILSLVLVAAAACAHKKPAETASPAPAATAPAAPAPAPKVEEITETVETEEGAVELQVLVGAPEVVGCADGQREAFADLERFPGLAGCLASWTEALSLRAEKTGGICGDDASACAAPADACAEGWHLCSVDGAVSDLTTRVDAEQCREAAAGGSFVAAISHCAAQDDCEYGAPEPAERTFPCFENDWCSEPVCCGEGCGMGACPDGVWPGLTHIAQGTDQGCGRITAARAGGVMCCRD